MYPTAVLYPSVAAFKDDGEQLVGLPAKRQAVTNAENTLIEGSHKVSGEHFSLAPKSLISR